MASDRIVVGTDGSESSVRAVDWAIRHAEVLGVSVEVVHVWSRPVLSPEVLPIRRDGDAYEARANALLRIALDTARHHHGGKLRGVRGGLLEGDAAEELTRRARDAHELVVGLHGRGFAGRELLGSVAERCLAATIAPVTVVPEPVAHDAHGIVVGVDGSPDSQAALEFAMSEAVTAHMDLQVVWAYPPGSAILDLAEPAAMPTYGSELVRGMLEVAIANGAALPPTLEVVPFPGRPASALVNGAMGKYELVVGFSGQRGARDRLGSVSRRCAHHATCAVTVVRAASERGAS